MQKEKTPQQISASACDLQTRILKGTRFPGPLVGCAFANNLPKQSRGTISLAAGMRDTYGSKSYPIHRLGAAEGASAPATY